ncbi:GntR family transcriptional regulator [Vibrio sp. PP-XX7]
MKPTFKLYNRIANEFKQQIADGTYQVGEMLPAERIIAEQQSVSRTVVREAMIMLEVEGFVEVRKGSGIRVISAHGHVPEPTNHFILSCGPFELLQARQLIESNIAEFAATQASKQDLVALMKIQEQAKNEDRARDSDLDEAFHIQLARCTQNSVLTYVTELLWEQRANNPYWKKLHEHIEDKDLRSWCNDHDDILKAVIQKDAQGAKHAMWSHLENTKLMLLNAASDDYDRFLYCDSPIEGFPKE